MKKYVKISKKHQFTHTSKYKVMLRKSGTVNAHTNDSRFNKKCFLIVTTNTIFTSGTCAILPGGGRPFLFAAQTIKSVITT